MVHPALERRHYARDWRRNLQYASLIGSHSLGSWLTANSYKCVKFIEVNAQNLFSKYFAESGKLVAKLFSGILEFCEDSSVLVCVLIDEVESLTAARKTAMNGNEPSDAVRVVNSVLTHIDRLRNQSNCLILTTSNLTGFLGTEKNELLFSSI